MIYLDFYHVWSYRKMLKRIFETGISIRVCTYYVLNTHGTNKSINDDAISIKNSFFFKIRFSIIFMILQYHVNQMKSILITKLYFWLIV